MVKYTIICEAAALVLSNDWKEFMELKRKNRGRIRGKAFYACNGEKKTCTKRHCYKKGEEGDLCCYTTDIRYAKNFDRTTLGAYVERIRREEGKE